jgi:acetylornithine deacetylase/succinyl-diaminopimelate desuccinylase-like protein
MAAFVREHKDLLRADLAVTADGQLHASGRPTLKFGSRGIVSIELRARHAKRDVHSGNFGGVVPNPLWTLVHLLATMKNPAGEITVEGFYDGVVPPSDAERAIAAALPLDLEAFKAGLGLTRLDAPADRAYYDRLCFWPTLTINGLHGGYGGPGTKTVLPAEAVAKLDARLVAGQRPPDIVEKLRAHVAKHAPEVEFVCMEEGMWPSKTPTDTPWAAPLTEALRLAHGAEPLLYPAGFGSLPGYAFTDILRIPALVTPYANADAANHAPDENMAVENFYKGIRTGAAVVHMLGEQVG